MEDFFHRVFDKLNAHHQDEEGDQQATEVFNPAVAIRMVLIRRFGSHLKPRQSHRRGTHVRQVVESVRRDGDAAGEGPQQEFYGKQQQVAQNAYPAAQGAITGADPDVGGVVRIFDAPPDEKINHSAVQSFQMKFTDTTNSRQNGGAPTAKGPAPSLDERGVPTIPCDRLCMGATDSYYTVFP